MLIKNKNNLVQNFPHKLFNRYFIVTIYFGVTNTYLLFENGNVFH